jgi:adenine-specific DNA-methyltransferase
MDKKELRDIFELKYDIIRWQKVMRDVFNAKIVHQQPIEISLPTNNLAYHAFELGNSHTQDERLIGFYQVDLKPNVWIEANKVSLRGLLRNVYKYDVDGALIIFVQDEKWRFSYVSEVSEIDNNGNRIESKTESKRYTYLMGKGEVCRTASDRFYPLTNNPYKLEDLKDAFSVDKLNKEFFKKYTLFYDEFCNYLANPINQYRALFIDKKETEKDKQEKPIRDWVKIMLGRIVFLHFLQKKGWMAVSSNTLAWVDGDKRFIQNLFENS